MIRLAISRRWSSTKAIDSARRQAVVLKRAVGRKSCRARSLRTSPSTLGSMPVDGGRGSHPHNPVGRNVKMKPGNGVRGILYVSMAFAAVWLPGCEVTPPSGIRELDSDGSIGTVHRVELSHGRIVGRFASHILTSALSGESAPDTSSSFPLADLVPPDDSVRHWIARCSDDPEFCAQRREVVISFRETLALPHFPDPHVGEPPDSPANLEALTAAQNMSDALIRDHDRHLTHLFNELKIDGKPEEFYWIANASLVAVRVGDLHKILADSSIQYLEARFPDRPPPPSAASARGSWYAPRSGRESNALPTSPTDSSLLTIRDGRRIIHSDAYFELDSLRSTRGWIGLLDTGVRSTHVLLHDTLGRHSNLRFIRDCTYGAVGWRCGTRMVAALSQDTERTRGYDPAECRQYTGHGTASASVIAANGNLGDAYRGVTGHVLDSYKIYDCEGGFPRTDTAALLRGLEAAITNLNKIILIEIPLAPRRFHSIVLVAANNAFDVGAVVVAPVGNLRAEVFAPAFGRRIIASGALNARTTGAKATRRITLEQFDQQGFGPTPDGRHKPDIQTPTDLWAAGNCARRNTPESCSDTALIRYEMTSGAAPYAAAAASLLRNFLVLASDDRHVDPGHVYAHTILSGQRTYPFTDSTGAGLIQLPPLDGTRWWGDVTLSASQVVDIPLKAVDGISVDTLDAALWWPNPEQYVSYTAPGNDIDLELIDPRGVVRGSSTTVRNAFERTRAVARGRDRVEGDWTLRVRANMIHSDSQTVYWAAHGRLAVGSR